MIIMKKNIFTTEVSKEDFERYKIKMADYLEGIYQVNDISELSDAEIMQTFKDDMRNDMVEFYRHFHYRINKPALVCREKEDGLLVVDVCKDDIYKATEMCRGKEQRLYIEDDDFRFFGTACGDMVVRFAKDGCELKEGDFISNEDIDNFTEPVGGWLNNQLRLWEKELSK